MEHGRAWNRGKKLKFQRFEPFDWFWPLLLLQIIDKNPGYVYLSDFSLLDTFVSTNHILFISILEYWQLKYNFWVQIWAALGNIFVSL